MPLYYLSLLLLFAPPLLGVSLQPTGSVYDNDDSCDLRLPQRTVDTQPRAARPPRTHCLTPVEAVAVLKRDAREAGSAVLRVRRTASPARAASWGTAPATATRTEDIEAREQSPSGYR